MNLKRITLNKISINKIGVPIIGTPIVGYKYKKNIINEEPQEPDIPIPDIPEVNQTDIIELPNAFFKNPRNYRNMKVYQYNGTIFNATSSVTDYLATDPIPVDTSMSFSGEAVGFDGNNITIYPVVFLNENKEFLSAPKPITVRWANPTKYDYSKVEVPIDAKYVVFNTYNSTSIMDETTLQMMFKDPSQKPIDTDTYNDNIVDVTFEQGFYNAANGEFYSKDNGYTGWTTFKVNSPGRYAVRVKGQSNDLTLRIVYYDSEDNFKSSSYININTPFVVTHDKFAINISTPSANPASSTACYRPETVKKAMETVQLIDLDNSQIISNRYTRINGIQYTSGYINTDYTYQVGDIIECSWTTIGQSNNNDESAVLFGSRTSANSADSIVAFGTYINNNVVYDWAGTRNTDTAAVVVNQGKISMSPERVIIYNNDGAVYIKNDTREINGNCPIVLFSINQGTVVAQNKVLTEFNMFKVIRGTSVVKMFISVIDNNTNTVGIYDLVSRCFLSKIGGSDLIPIY